MWCYLVLVCVSSAASLVYGSSTYRAAILEHDVLPYKSSPLETMLANVHVYTDTAVKAKQMDADILVFPEYGIVGLDAPDDLKEEEYEEFQIYLPNEAVGHWIPCERPEDYSDGRPNHQILQSLSCAARNNSLVLVVNVITKESCNQSEESTCPSRGYFLFNTNIIFNKDGTLLARYHKRHLYNENALNPSPPIEFQVIDVGFMKFGTFICFDAMYGDPAVEYVTKAGVRNLVFSTAWLDELPYLSAPQLFSRMARGLGVNLIASNAYIPQIARLGSGIYSSVLGAINETNDLATPGRLLVAEIPINPLPVAEEEFRCSFTADNASLSDDSGVPYTKSILTDKPSSSPTTAEHKIYFQNLQNFSKVFLESKEGNASLCKEDLCCHVEYALDDYPTQEEVYVLAMQNAFHPFGKYKFYMQVCSVLRCESNDIATCGRVPEKSTTVKFTRLSLTGSFATTTLFPSILATDLLSFPDSEWEFTRGKCSDEKTEFRQGGRMMLKSPASKPIMVASIYGRVYDRD